jgi:hypothetical protein
MITNIKTGRMGTVEFDAKFAGMRKAQDFITYPIPSGADTTRVKVQSDTRIGYIDLTDGTVTMSPSISNGAHFHHLAQAKQIDKLSGEELILFKAQIMGTASGKAGTNGIIFSDNSGALEVLKAD